MQSHEWDNHELMADIEAEEEMHEKARNERLATLARRLVAARERKDASAKIAAKDEEDFKREQAVFWEALDEADMPTTTLDLGEPYGRVQFQRRQTVRSTIVDKTTAEKSLRDAGLDYMLESVGFRKRPLNQHVSEALKAGDPLPDGVGFTSTRFVTISRKD